MRIRILLTFVLVAFVTTAAVAQPTAVKEERARATSPFSPRRKSRDAT